MKILKTSALTIILVLFQAFMQPATAAHYKKKKHTAAAKAEKVQDSVCKNAFLAFPLAFFASNVKMGYERLLPNGKGLQFQLSYATGENNPSFYDNLQSFDEYALEVQYKVGLKRSNKWYSGFYMAPFISFRTINGVYTNQRVDPLSGEVTTTNERAKANVITPGYLVGFQRTVNDFFVFGFYAGGGVNIPSGDYSKISTNLGLYNKGVTPHFGLSIGVLF